ncbi:SDR family NAD(P)-dependent oxidoreductase [Desulfurella sp.]|uniref:SDR family NAD(P)-dependent oxidoreductase n=1 Tax=Desulfurella sp. TaxID=1962857 RepID=UPI0025BE3C2F|nr:SDR family NAD(P)-dependent oxidoreductase [Desulfurella sp.]
MGSVLITGASSGIGKACAEIFANGGYNLILNARRIDRLEELSKNLIEKNKVKVYYKKTDMSKKDEIFEFVDSIPEDFFPIDVLVNNAGLSRGLESLDKGNIDDWNEMIDTNIKGVLYITKLIIPIMKKQGYGHIINLGSIAGHESYPGGNVYCATKAAIKSLTKSLRMDLLRTNIRVSSVDPGMVETEFSEVRFRDKEKAKKVYENIKPLYAQDIADVIYFIATRPQHVNIEDVIIMPTQQASVLINDRDYKK